MGIKKYLSLGACKGARGLLRKLNRGGTMFPGKLALGIDKEILREVSEGVTTIIVAGTNGKTTTALMIAEGLRNSGFECFSNSSGANMFGGICAEYIMNTDIHGKPKKKIAVIECDEGSLKYVVPRVDPAVILVTNVFRDQLDRYGEVYSTYKLIDDGVSGGKNAVFVLNADCSLLTSMGEDRKALYYGFDINLDFDSDEVNDVTRCIKCGGEMKYKSHTYGHLGDFFCPMCGYSKPETQVSLLEYNGEFNGSDMKIKSGDQVYEARLALPAVYNAYNALSAMAVFEALNIEPEGLIKTFGEMTSAFGRMEQFEYRGKELEMILVKNPAGCNRVLEYLKNGPEKISIAILLNDKPQDGTDISWIWDTDYTGFLRGQEDIKLFTGGTRAEDMALRLKYAGAKDVTICESAEDIFEKLTSIDGPSIILPNYTSMLAMRKVLQKNCGGKDFWEV